VGTIDLEPILENTNIAALRKGPVIGKRRLWLRFGVKVDMDITVVVSWRPNGRKVSNKTDICSATLILDSLDLPNEPLLNDFRAPIQQRETSDSSISNDTLLAYLKKLEASLSTFPPSNPGK
jgi:hypothetical protein